MNPLEYPANLRRTSLVALAILLLFVFGCSGSSPTIAPSPTSATLPTPVLAPTHEVTATPLVEPKVKTPVSQAFLLRNQGGAMEGHTPRGFSGKGTGLFAGDNRNPRFPEGDGVQLFLTFDLSTLPSGKVLSAVLRSENASVRGMPMKDLGSLRAEEVRYSEFSPALWNLERLPSGESCVFATSSGGPFRCDLSGAVQRSLNDSYPLAQFRLLLDQAGDGDGTTDLVTFFVTDSNTNQPGIFELEVTLEPEN